MHLKRTHWIVLLSVGVLLVAGYLGWQYTQEDEYRLFALNARTGRVAWSTPLETSYTPAAGNGRVFAYSTAPLSGEIREYLRKNFDHRNTVRTIKLCAFDAATGRPLWEYVIDPKQFEVALSSMANPPVVSKQWVALNLNEDTLGVLDASRGLLQWYSAQAVSPSYTQSFTFASDRVITISKSGAGSSLTVQALDAQTGALIWQANPTDMSFLDIDGRKPAITTSDQLVFVSSHNSVEAFDLRSGVFKFRVETDSHQLQVVGDILYINAGYSLWAVDATTGARRWTFQATVSGETPYLLGLETVGQVTYIAGVFGPQHKEEGAWLYALNASDGRELWRKKLNQMAWGASGTFLLRLPAAGLEAVLITIEDEKRNFKLMAFSAVDGAELWHFPLNSDSSPVIQDNLVFVTGSAPRWRNWLSHIDPAWHAIKE